MKCFLLTPPPTILKLPYISSENISTYMQDPWLWQRQDVVGKSNTATSPLQTVLMETLPHTQNPRKSLRNKAVLEIACPTLQVMAPQILPKEASTVEKEPTFLTTTSCSPRTKQMAAQPPVASPHTKQRCCRNNYWRLRKFSSKALALPNGSTSEMIFYDWKWH